MFSIPFLAQFRLHVNVISSPFQIYLNPISIDRGVGVGWMHVEYWNIGFLFTDEQERWWFWLCVLLRRFGWWVMNYFRLNWTRGLDVKLLSPWSKILHRWLLQWLWCIWLQPGLHRRPGESGEAKWNQWCISVSTQVDYSVDYRVDYGGGEEGLVGPHQPHARLEGSFDQVFYNEDHFDYLQYQDLFWISVYFFIFANICYLLNQILNIEINYLPLTDCKPFTQIPLLLCYAILLAYLFIWEMRKTKWK